MKYTVSWCDKLGRRKQFFSDSLALAASMAHYLVWCASPQCKMDHPDIGANDIRLSSDDGHEWRPEGLEFVAIQEAA
ncbi:MAG TPA: hypothetical protein VFA28_01855 [Bryobacteraceae bacterium]|nr:hypothetical protein [Bryobacteraceae bacterium]